MTDLPKPCLALVTGATGGIGQATCKALALLGCDIAVHYNSASSTASSLVSELTSPPYSVRAASFQADLSSYDAARKLHADVVSALGGVNVLFNNAGVTLGKTGVRDIRDVSADEFERTWRANCGTGFVLSQLVLPGMEEAGWGRVVFCSSVAGFTGGVVGPHYASSKSSIHGLVHWISAAYCAKGITANAVAPALIQDTKMLPGHNEELAKKIPAGRLGRPQEVAETVVWMVKTGYVTNKVVCVDGGMFAQ